MEDKAKKYVELLKTKLVELDQLQKDPVEEKVSQWKFETLMVLDKLISPTSKYYKEFEFLDFQSKNQLITENYDIEAERKEGCLEDLRGAKSLLSAIIFGVENGLA